MPRLTSSDHHHRHSLLRLLWLEAPAIFSILSPAEQWDLHELYHPSEHLTEAELSEHLAGLRKTKPSLASKVGKSYALITRVYNLLIEYDIPLSDHEAVNSAIQPFDKARALHQLEPPDVPARSNRKPQHLHAAPIMKPELDVHQLSRAIWALVETGPRDGSAWDLPPGSEDDSRAA